MSRLLAIAGILASLALAACGGGANEQTGSSSSERQAIYLFDKETSDTSRCYGAGAIAWPPVLIQAAPRAGEAVQ